jgi:hypothetical protein
MPISQLNIDLHFVSHYHSLLLNLSHDISERNKIIEEKQMRLDEVEKALSELRTVCIVWPNPASEVLLTGSFDGWTSQVSTCSKSLLSLLNTTSVP